MSRRPTWEVELGAMHQRMLDEAPPCECVTRFREIEAAGGDIAAACQCKHQAPWNQCDCALCACSLKWAVHFLKQMGGSRSIQ